MMQPIDLGQAFPDRSVMFQDLSLVPLAYFDHVCVYDVSIKGRIIRNLCAVMVQHDGQVSGTV